VFKNEAKYLEEWLDYHLCTGNTFSLFTVLVVPELVTRDGWMDGWLGVEHFYLFNHHSNDNYLAVLDPYIDAVISRAKPVVMSAISDTWVCHNRVSFS
jgi:hypothetical protein